MKRFTVVMAVYNVEKYLAEAVDSLRRQSVGFSDIKLVLVDDGSTDGSGALCDAYARRYPNVIALHKPNGGVASARNLGLEHAEGIVNFMDADDRFSRGAFRAAERYLLRNPDVDIATVPIRFFGAASGPHWQNEKFSRGTRTVFTDEEPFAPLMFVNATFFRLSAAKEIVFDSAPACGEDLLAVSRLLLSRRKFGVVTGGRYDYRRRKGSDDSLIGLSQKKPSWYEPYLDSVTFPLYEEGVRADGKCPLFLQYTLAQDLVWHVMCPAERARSVLGAAFPAYAEKLSRALGLFEPCVVEKLKFLSPCAREMWLLRTGGTPPAPEAAAQDLYERDNKLVFELTVSAKAPPAVFADAGEGIVPCECTPAGQERTFDGGIIGERMRVRFFLPLPKKCVFVRFFYEKEGEKLPFSAFSFEKFFPLSSIRGSYCAVGDCLVDFGGGAFRVRRRRFLRHLAAEARFEASLCRRGGRGLFCAALRAFYRVARPFVRGVWLLSDRDDAAGDNGEALFDYLNAHPAKGRKVYFVLDRNSPDYPRLQKKGKVVPCLSVKHLLLYLFAEVSASSQADRGARAFAVPELRDLWTKVRFAFLQHGVTKDDVSAVYGKYAVRPDLFVTCAPRECASVCAGEGYALGDEVVLTGFARHDLLRDESAGRRVITFMPTWRRYCVLGHAADVQTDYFRFYSELLCDERLLGAAKRFGYELQFLGHPFMRETDALLPLPPQVKRPQGEERDYNRIFCESALIVTDYSSAAFDFAYLGKPVVYAQFDAAEFFSTHTYTRGYFDYAADGFGPVCGTAEETAEEIILLMRSGCENPEKYAARAADFFAFRDEDNCERIEAAIRRMLTREKR